MIKVKEWLDKNLFCVESDESVLHLNGNYGVFGTWIYPKNWKPAGVKVWGNLSDEERKKVTSKDHIKISINNETIILGNMSVNGKWSIYHYAQTYEHIPRGEPDINGYYARSTDEEVIKYIDEYLQKIKQNENIK